jgi:glucokinase
MKAILAVDIGGTNISYAIMTPNETGYTKSYFQRFSTKLEHNLNRSLEEFINSIKDKSLSVPEILCISAAGIIEDKYVFITNAGWGINSEELQKDFNFSFVYLINDFTAISWGCLSLDLNNQKEVTNLSEIQCGALGTMVILGAGTGLGCGYITFSDSKPSVHASEGGHAFLPVYDSLSEEFFVWLLNKYGIPPYTELGVSGIGINNIFEFFAAHETSITEANEHILSLCESERPEKIALSAKQGDFLCNKTMNMFVTLYAHAAQDAAVLFLPKGGIFLAGGIAAKNSDFFLRDSFFMKTFLNTGRKHTEIIVSSVPVHIVMNYDISLYGAAAFAAEEISKGKL